MDCINGKEADAVARALRPADYEDGRGLSAAGKKVEAQLCAADDRATGELPIALDTSWLNPRGACNVS